MSIAACPTTGTAPITGVVVFEPAVFITLYPMFAGIASTILQFNFDLATLLLANDCCNVVTDALKRERLLGLLTAHITYLFNGTNNGAGVVTPPVGIVGRIASATEGSVTAAAEYASTMDLNAAFLTQSPWGALFLAGTAVYRTARYVPAPQRNYGPFPFYGGPGFGFGGGWGGNFGPGCGWGC